MQGKEVELTLNQKIILRSQKNERLTLREIAKITGTPVTSTFTRRARAEFSIQSNPIGRPFKDISKEDYEKIIQLHKSGTSIRAIAGETGISRTAVKNLLKRYEAERRETENLREHIRTRFRYDGRRHTMDVYAK